MKDKEAIRQGLKDSPRLKKWLDYIIMNQRDARPRWYIRMLAPFYQRRGYGSKIYSSVRMDTPPYRNFSLGKSQHHHRSCDHRQSCEPCPRYCRYRPEP